MKALSNVDLLALWELGLRRHPIDQALLLGAWSQPDYPSERLADLPLGEVNVALLRLREACFGARIDAYVDCEHCGERLEFALHADELLADIETGQGRGECVVEGFRFRAPCWRDLAAVAGESNAELAARQLMERCCIERPVDGPELAELADEIESALAVLDPASEFRVALGCDACGHHWATNLDVGGLLWDEIDAHARTLLAEVHSLALAYGWSEAEILALSPQRRTAYLQMVNP